MEIDHGENLFAPVGDDPSIKRSRNFYDVLEVSRGADRAEVRRAYIRLKGALENSQGAAYSLLEPGDSEAALSELEEAYRYLDDEYLRRRYDEKVFGAGNDGPPFSSQEAPGGYHKHEDDSPPQTTLRRYRLTRKHAKKSLDESVQARIQELISQTEIIDGALIKRIREAVDVSKQEVQSYLKISNFFVDALEEDVYEDLPPPVYVRGFIKSMLEYLGVKETTKVIDGYTKRYEEWKKKHTRK